MHRLEELQKRMTLWVHGLGILVVTIVASFVLLLTYWALEPDPLTVKPYNSDSSVCHDRQFSFTRYVHSDKPLDIYVQQRWHNKDSGNYKGIEKEIVISTPDYYPLGKDFQKIMQFTKCVPDNIETGRYEYRPWATYKVNPIKTVHRLLPVQNVDVVCDFDPSKHKPCNVGGNK